MQVLKIDRTRLLLEDTEIPSSALQEIAAMSGRRAAGEPIRYITGVCPFLDMEFYVDSSTLIPRPETELLAETVSKYLETHPQAETLWDLGCGSGCIGLSLAHRHPNLRVAAMDISTDALAMAEKNARRWGLADRVQFFAHDLCSGPPPLPAPAAVVSNPPYIPTGQLAGLQREVRDYEPIAALDGGPDGLRFYRQILALAPPRPGGLLALEIGYDQGETVPSLLEAAHYARVTLLRDLAGLPRVVTGVRTEY